MKAPSPQPAGRLIEFALLGLLALLWGSSYLFIKVALTAYPPLTLIALRVSLAALILLAIMRLQSLALPTDGATWRHLFVQSLLNSTVAWTLLAWGQQFLDSGLAGVLNSTSPIFVVIFAALFTHHEPVHGWKLGGALLGLSGVVMILGVDVLAGLGGQLPAQLAVLFAAMLFAMAAIYGRRFAGLPPVVTAAGTMVCSSVLLVPLSLVIDRPWGLQPTPLATASALLLATLCTALALMIYFRLVRTLGSLGVASQAYLRSGVSVVLGMMLLGEVPEPIVGVGLVVVIIGVAAINRPASVRHHQPGDVSA